MANWLQPVAQIDVIAAAAAAAAVLAVALPTSPLRSGGCARPP